MSWGGSPEGRRGRPGIRLVGALLPGLPQVASGRWGAGGAALLMWAGLLAVGAFNPVRVHAALSGPWDARLAFGVWAAGLVGAWLWSWRDLGIGAEPDQGGWGRWVGSTDVFSRNRTAVVGVLVVGLLYMLALLAPLLTPFDPTAQGDLLRDAFLPPGHLHPLGTDQYGRDVLARLLYGARISLSIGFVAVGISSTLGTVLGAVAAYVGGIVGWAIMRLVDVVLSFPRLILLIAVIGLFRPSIFLIVAVLGLTLWPSTARLVYAEVRSLRERDFILAARVLGYSRRRIVLRHLIPNALAPVIVTATLGIGNTIVLEAGLSFLGLGVQAPTPSWGSMVADGRSDLLGAWWLAMFPGLAIVLSVLAFNLVGDGIRDALDPRLRS